MTELSKVKSFDSFKRNRFAGAGKSNQQLTALPGKLSSYPMNNLECGGNPVQFSVASLLPRIRFLLPLCSQRWRLVHELLHATELSAPDFMPVVTVDRRVPLIDRHGNTRNSVFSQIIRELKREKLHFRYVHSELNFW